MPPTGIVILNILYEEEMHLTFTYVNDGCDEAIGAGALEVYRKAKYYQAKQKKNPSRLLLQSYMRRHLDASIKAWLHRYDIETSPFSELLQRMERDALIFFKQLYQRYEDDWGWVKTQAEFPELALTVDVLIEMADFYCLHRSEHEQRVALVPTCTLEGGSSTKIIVVETKRRALGKTMAKHDLPTLLDFRDYGPENRHCQLCTRLTEQAEEIIRVFEHPQQITEISPEALLLINQEGTRFQTKGFATDYCSLHSPTLSNASYRKAMDRLEDYFALHRLLILVRQFDRRLGGVHPFISRHSSFLLADACSQRSLVRATTKAVKEWAKGGINQDDCVSQMHECLRALATSLRADGHPLFKLALAYLDLPTGKLADMALGLNVLSAKELEWMARGFITDPITRLARNRKVAVYEN